MSSVAEFSVRSQPNFRRLRNMLALSSCGSVNLAAEALNVGAASVSRSIRELEEEFSRALFLRTSRGLVPTPTGDTLIHRSQRLFDYLRSAESEIALDLSIDIEQLKKRQFVRRVTYRQLITFIAVVECGTETQAARVLDRSQPAVTMAISELEQLIGEALFSRTAKGMFQTVVGVILSKYAKLALFELTAAMDDIHGSEGRVTGKITIGSLSLSGSFLIPKAIDWLVNRYPLLRVEIMDGTYSALTQRLKTGELDLIVGAFDFSANESDFDIVSLFVDKLVVVSGAKHPITQLANVTLEHAVAQHWVLPRRQTPARELFDTILTRAGHQLQHPPIETNSIAITRGFLVSGTRLCVMSQHQLRIDENASVLTRVIPTELGDLNVGMKTLRGSLHRLSVSKAILALKAVGRQLGPRSQT